MISAREAAFQALGAFRHNGAWADVFLKNISDKKMQDARETALAYRIVYGVLQNRLLIDHYISAFSSVKIKKMQDAVVDILELSTYQLTMMDKIPESAAVNEAVRLSKKHCPKAAGFVNAVLRKIAASKNSLPPVPEQGTARYLSVKYSHPEWLVSYFINNIGYEETELLLTANNSICPVYSQVNTLKANATEVESELEREGFLFKKHPWKDKCFELQPNGELEHMSVFREGKLQVQDIAARLAVEVAKPSPGMSVIDTCAAPGGKSFAAAMMMENNGKILSCDIYSQKLKEMEKTAKRLGVSIVETCKADAAVFNPQLEHKFDIVIADVPCSGIGVIRKKPEIRYKSEAEISAMPEIQRKIISNVSRYVKPNGVLLYSTCTLMKSENEEIVEDFVSGNKNFSFEPFAIPCMSVVAEKGMLTLLPHIYGTDGFFICKLRRNGE